jgi:peptidoglycan/LPS O-acetylase OafA/YrhL
MLIWQALRQRPRVIDLAILADGIILCFVEIIARSAEINRLFAHPVRVAGLAYEALATFIVAVFAIWLLARINDQVKLKERTKRMLRLIGLTTYPLYLMHEGVGGVAYGLLRQSGHGQGAALLIGLSLSLMASLLVVLAVEPLLRQWMLAAVHPLLARLTANDSLSRALGTFRPPSVILKPVRGEGSARVG